MAMSPRDNAQLAVLTALMQEMNKRAEEDRENHQREMQEANMHREAVVKRLSELSNITESLLSRMGQAEVVTGFVTNWRSRFVGAGVVLGLIGAPILLVATYFWDLLVQSFKLH